LSYPEHGVTASDGAILRQELALHGPLTFLPPGTGLQQKNAAPAPSGSAADIGIEVLSSAAAFAELAPEWNRLHGEAAAASVFNSWIWQFQWWQVYGRDRPLRLLVAWEGDAVVGILPLYVHRVRVLGVPVRLLRLVGTGGDTHPDDLEPILQPGCARAAAHELARAALALRGADLLLLTDLAPDGALRAAVESAAILAGRPVLAGVSERIAFIRLPQSWQEYLGRLSSHARTGVRYKRRRLAKGRAVRFFVWDDAAHIDAAFDRLAGLHRRRWAALGGSESFASAEYLEFHRRVIKACLPRGWLRLYCLEIDGEVEAMIYAYRFRGAVYCMQTGFEPAMRKLKVGSVLLGYAFEHAIGEGNAVFDFLRGDHGYKDRHATDHRETAVVRVFRATPGALLYRLRRIWLPLLKARLMRRPPPRLRP
jgi:CelD/BcsL family acetyltransferase involved in cellulose biosynthesis